MVHSARTAALLLLLALVACRPPVPPVVVPVPPAAPTAVLRVEVYRGPVAGDHKLAGATVRVKDVHDAWLTGTTDGAGNVEFGPLPLDFYRVVVEAEGYQAAEEDFALTPATRVRRVPLAATAAPPPVVPSARRGPVRLQGRALVDDGGPFLAHGATCMWCLWAYLHDRPKLDRELTWLQETGGVNFVRVLATVGGPYWEDPERTVPAREVELPDGVIDPGEAGFDQALRGFADLAWTYGLRTEWTIFGGINYTPTRESRQRLVDRVLASTVGREPAIILIELANEGYHTGFEGPEGLAELRGLTRYANDHTTIPVAASSFHEDLTDHCALYQGGVANVGTYHFDRSSGVEGSWRAVRQPWGYNGEIGCAEALPTGSDNEPIGPGSSVASESDPTKLIAARIVAHVAGLPYSVLHTDAGVRGDRPFASHPTLARTLRGLAALTAQLPGDLPAWTRTRPGLGGCPWQTDQFWADDGADHGVVRLYAAVAPDRRSVAVALGVRRYVDLRAEWAMTVDVLDPLTGAVAQTRQLAAGQSFRLEEGSGAWVLRTR